MEGLLAQVHTPKLFPEEIVNDFRDVEVSDDPYPREHPIHTDSISILR